ncbi:MAG: hypothetical protein RQM92_04800 [Candidatus Syntrophopropionicum ammoniitolerans]
MKQTNKCAQPNKNGHPQAESVEQRPPNKGNPGQTTGSGTQRPPTTSLGLDRVREAARRTKTPIHQSDAPYYRRPAP